MKKFNVDEFRDGSLPSEKEVMVGWKDNKPLVSIICTTYNHKEYIDDAIRGFLIQETDFPFEIIIHDDASTDGTDSIIKHYAQCYPSLIVPILQNENQFSKGRRIIPIAASFAKGKYCALCEGDDFWVDAGKLQKQITTMEEKQDCKISFHSCFSGNPDAESSVFRRKIKDYFLFPHTLNVFSVRSVILGDMPTASLVIKAEVFKELPSCFDKFPLGDYFLQIIASSPAGAVYIPHAMSFYRVSSNGSWSSKLAAGYEHKLRHWRSMRAAVRALDAHMAGEYSNAFNKYMSWNDAFFFENKQVPDDVKIEIAVQQADLNRTVARGVRYLSINRRVGHLYFFCLVQKARVERYIYFGLKSFSSIWSGRVI